MTRVKQKYTSKVTEPYKQETANKQIRYTIEENISENPAIKQEFDEWTTKRGPREVLSFEGVFHPDYEPPMFDIRGAEIREDYGQRNALTERTRTAKVLGIAKKFNPKQFQPIDIDIVLESGAVIIRDGGARATAACLNGLFEVPASVRYVEDVNESRSLFNQQHNFKAAISSYDKFLQQLLDVGHKKHNVSHDIWSISNSSGFSLHDGNKSAQKPLIRGINTLQRVIRNCGGDNGVKWGKKTAPNLSTAVDVIKETFPGIDEIPVSVLEAVTAFIHISRNRIPSGNEGRSRLADFMKKLRSSDPALENIKIWASRLGFDASNSYATYGASSLMVNWNLIFKNANKGRRNSYKYVKWKQSEIDTTKLNLHEFARDESLYPTV